MSKKLESETPVGQLRLVGPDWKPPVGGMGGSVHDWERGSSPWHRSAFPGELADQAPEQGDCPEGWYALDWCGNQIGFIADGTPWPNTHHTPPCTEHQPCTNATAPNTGQP